MCGVKTRAGFRDAARDACAFLRQRLGFELWVIGQVDADRLTVLHTDGPDYGVAEGFEVTWNDTHCARMLRGDGPPIAPATAAIPAYADAPLARRFTIGAYAGVPLTDSDGKLLGTLSAFDPAPQPDAVAEELPTIEIVGRMLGRVLESDRRNVALASRARSAEDQALADPLTGLYNRRGWARRLAAEDSRCLRYVSPACVLAVDIDGLKKINDTRGHAAGDDVLLRAADAMRVALRDQDVLARVGGDEFLVLGVACDRAGARSLSQRIAQALDQAGVPASVGLAQHDPEVSLAETAERADRAMYADKRSRAAR